MSSKRAHLMAGGFLSLVGGLSIMNLRDPLLGGAFAAGALFGAALPDQLEIKWHSGGGRRLSLFGSSFKEGVRHSLIPHRTITHWLLFWVVATAFAAEKFYWYPKPTTAFFCGLFLSGLLHVVMDSRTRMGVPWLHPFKRVKGY